MPREHGAALAKSIETVLRLVFVELLEVPFIWQYRRDVLWRQLSLASLWRIVDLDAEWTEMCARRRSVCAWQWWRTDIRTECPGFVLVRACVRARARARGVVCVGACGLGGWLGV